VELYILRVGIGAILHGRTDLNGSFTFHATADTGTFALAARKIGFRPAQVPLRFDPGDTLTAEVELEPTTTPELPGVRVEAARGRNYFIDSAEIAATRGRVIDNAFDILRKLRPDMLGDKGRCPGLPVDNIWINGRRVLFMAAIQSAVQRGSSGAGGAVVRRRGASTSKPTSEPDLVDSVLASIKRADVAEIRYVNCWDVSMSGMGTNNAIYVVLKPGVTWDYGLGSHADSNTARIRKPD
jgi:hypothetical protein